MQPVCARPAPTRSRLPVLAQIAYWSLPSVVLLAIYWRGLTTSYFRDDFAWLALHQSINSFSTFLTAMFQPYAQGTVRPISERLFFTTGWLLSGMEAFPLRVIAFATQIANLVLLTAITRKLTGSALAGMAAPLLWVVNANLYMPLAWTAAYNQILCAFVLLLSLHWFIRYTETGKTRYYRGQWFVFVFGLGVLELTVVYPALIALYAFCCARPYWTRALPMAAVSAVYTVVHQYSTPEQRPEAYRMYFDLTMFETLGRYVSWSAGAHTFADFRSLPMWPFYAAEGLVLVALAAFAVRMLLAGRWLAAFLIGWFLVVLAPVLPLRNHATDYYLTIPVIGLAMLGAWALSEAFRKGRIVGMLAIFIALAYAVPSIWAARSMHSDYYAVSRRVRTFVAGVAYAHKLHPGKTLLIHNVDSELYWSAWHDRAFRLFGLQDIYLTGDSAVSIEPKPREGLGGHTLPDTLALEGLNQGQVVVYEVAAGDRLRNSTLLHHARLARARRLPLPSFLDVGLAWSSVHLGEGWWPLDTHFRWTGQRASLQLRGPLRSGGQLILRGHCPQQHMARGPLRVTVSVEGQAYPSTHIDRENQEFRLAFPLPDSTVRKPAMQISVEVDRVLQHADDLRQLGLAFGTFEVIP